MELERVATAIFQSVMSQAPPANWIRFRLTTLGAHSRKGTRSQEGPAGRAVRHKQRGLAAGATAHESAGALRPLDAQRHPAGSSGVDRRPGASVR